MVKKKDLDIEEIKRLYSIGKSSSKIAKDIGCSPALIIKILHEEGIQLRKIKAWNKKKILEEEKNKIIKLYIEKNLSLKEIGKLFNYSGWIIKTVLLDNNIKLRTIKERYANSRVNINCDFCGKEKSIILYYFKNVEHHFCDKFCYDNYYKLHPLKYWSGKKLSKEHKEKFHLGNKKYREENLLYNEIDLSEHKEFIKEMYEKGNDSRHIGVLLGVSTNTILRNMKKWGFSRRKPLRDKISWKADDGHIVKSSAEMYIDNWLFHNGIVHIYEKNLGETRFTCDFYIKETNTYIENWGMINQDYLRKMQKKLDMYKKLGLLDNLISIFPKEKIEDKLRFLLSISKIQKNLKDFEDEK